MIQTQITYFKRMYDEENNRCDYHRTGMPTSFCISGLEQFIDNAIDILKKLYATS